MDTLTAKSEATYATIIDAALDMAAVDGIGKLSLGELAKRTGISKSGVFSAWARWKACRPPCSMNTTAASPRKCSCPPCNSPRACRA